KVAASDPQGVDEREAQLEKLGQLGIDLEHVCKKLTEEGLDLFSKALDQLLRAVSGRSIAQKGRLTMKVDERLGKKRDAAQEGLRLAEQKKMAQRLWAKDATLWGDDPKHQAVA